MSWIVSLRRNVFVLAASFAAISHASAAEDVTERGEYLVRAGNCISCHTAPGGRVFAGGVPFPTDFGTIYSTNITPDPKTGIGGWTFAQFDAAMRKGVRPDGSHLYPAFPYPNFTKLSEDDVQTLYAYFMSIRPIEQAPTPNTMKFPFGQRALMGAWKAMFFEEGKFQPDPKQSEQWNRGAYLVQGLAHCGACHTPRNLLGAEKMDRAFSGGVLREVMDDRDLARAAPDLTPASNGLGAWSE
ncbi:MAG: cytochrome c, partial [Steroidobacteraceae bacterium]